MKLPTLFILILALPAFADDAPLPGTKPLTMEGDIASNLVAGVDKFLLRELDKSVERRTKLWKRDPAIEPKRARLAKILGVVDPRTTPVVMQRVAINSETALVGRGEGFEVFAVSWPAFGDVSGEGLLLEPTKRKPVANIIAIPDADVTPEQFVFAESSAAARLAASGCRVVVPVLIDRHLEKRRGNANVTNREFLYRSAYELGRHLIGYEIQKVLAVVDWFGKDTKIGVIGHGEGGLLAFYAAALDTRIDVALVSGYFDDRRNLWQEPIDRNIFGLLDQFGDAELAAMIAPRKLAIENAKGPELTLPSEGGAPGRLVTDNPVAVLNELYRAKELVLGLKLEHQTCGICSPDGFRSEDFINLFLNSVAPRVDFADAPKLEQKVRNDHPEVRQARQFHEIDRHNQALLTESSYVRAEFMKKLDTSSPEKYQQSVEWYRNYFRDEVIGRFDEPMLPANPRTRKWKETGKWTGYEVVLDVWPDVMAYGILLLPKDLKPGEKRPVVVCQHGLEGRPPDTIIGDNPAYHDFAAKLAERGFITFAPQNLYIFGDRFRTLQRKANPLGKTLFSIIVPQHQQITDWLKTLPNVDGERIAFYGLSYGGKTAMRVPPLVSNYCLSICSADFNEWVWKNASTRAPSSYVWTGEYEIFEFDLGSTFNYAEMAALIAPRPFMVERGHFDGVSSDEAVGYEFAKVRNLYEARLGIGDRCEIEWFVGPHTINGKGTFDFLHKHLKWPKPGEDPKPR